MSKRRQDPEGAECVWWDTLALDKLAAWCRGAPKGEIGPNDLMRHPWRLTRNAACSALEALEARGVLERIPGQALAWKLAGGAHPKPDGRRLSIILSDKEHAALLVGLDILAEIGQVELRLTPDRLASLRSLRSRLLRKDTP